jgi:predicted outer membrane repeat protein
LGVLACPAGNILYVNAAVTSTGDGITWGTAFKTLQEALTAANFCPSVTQIWVAKGTYYPDEGGSFANNDRNAAFVMKSGVSIYGGFEGNEAANYDLSLRNFVTNETTLSGDLDQNDGANFANNGGNAYHVIYNNNNQLHNNTILDGFTVKGSNANGSVLDGLGGGMFNYGSSPTVSNCWFTGNTATSRGAGLSAFYNAAWLQLPPPLDNIKVSKCTFSNNNSGGSGGGMETFQNQAIIENTTFSQNSANYGGGGLYVRDCGIGAILSNVVFSENTAGSIGGGIASTGSNVTVINGTFSNNSVSNPFNAATAGGGIFHSNDIGGARLRLLNCILWGNTSAGNINTLVGSIIFATNCDIQGNSRPGVWVNCIDQDPLFINAADPDGADNLFGTADDGLRLQACSPAINTGVSSATVSSIVLNAPTADFLENARVGTTDMGAYEYQSAPPSILYVNQAVSSSGDGTTWATAFKTLQEALQLNCPSVTQIWVAAGTYYPTADATGNLSPANARTKTFVMKNNLAIYGGFPNDGTGSMANRNWTTNPTILSGEIQQDNDASNNSFHVILNYQTSLTSTAVLDGFTITGGDMPYDIGGSWGGGMLNFESSPSLSNITFSGNSARFGGGMFNHNSTPSLSNVTFSGNSAEFGGGMFSEASIAGASRWRDV